MDKRLASSALVTRALGSLVHAALILGLALGPQALASQASAAESAAPAPAGEAAAVTDFEELVGPVALYPDELLAIVLPASTFPLHIVEASRYLEKKKSNPDLEPDEDWDESIVGLLNYPEVLELMNDDLDWTWELGAAVADHESDVMEAVQSFRGKAKKAGNLATNEKMKVADEEVENQETKEKETVIVIESTSPEVIYVPQYEPSTVVVYQSAPYPWYYSPPYPYYYHPAAAFWTGVFVGSAVAYGLHWGHHHHHGSINVNRNVNVNVNKNNISNRQANLGGSSGSWNKDRAKTTQAGGRPGQKNAGSRPSTGQMNKAKGTRAGGKGAGTTARTGSRDTASKNRGAASKDRGAASSRSGTRSSKSREMTSPSRQRSNSASSHRSSVGRYESHGAARSHSSRGQREPRRDEPRRRRRSHGRRPRGATLMEASIRSIRWAALSLVVWFSVGCAVLSGQTTGRTFDSPEAAVDALLAALDQEAPEPLLDVLGPGFRDQLVTADWDFGRETRSEIVERSREKLEIDRSQPNVAEALIGTRRLAVSDSARAGRWAVALRHRRGNRRDPQPPRRLERDDGNRAAASIRGCTDRVRALRPQRRWLPRVRRSHRQPGRDARRSLLAG